MEIGLRVPLEAEVLTPGTAVLPARLLLDASARCPQRSVYAGAARGRAGHRVGLRQRDLPPPHASRRGLSAIPGARSRTARDAPGGRLRRDRRKVAGSASRDETRPVLTGILVSASGRGAADGRNRFLPTERQGDDARGAARAAIRGQRPGPGAAGADADRGADAAPIELTVSVASEPGRLRARDHPVLAADRRPVPELPPAAPGVLRARAATRRAGAARGRAPDQPAGAENAPLRLTFEPGDADGLGPDARRRRGERGDPVPFQGEP